MSRSKYGAPLIKAVHDFGKLLIPMAHSKAEERDIDRALMQLEHALHNWMDEVPRHMWGEFRKSEKDLETLRKKPQRPPVKQPPPQLPTEDPEDIPPKEESVPPPLKSDDDSPAELY